MQKLSLISTQHAHGLAYILIPLIFLLKWVTENIIPVGIYTLIRLACLSRDLTSRAAEPSETKMTESQTATTLLRACALNINKLLKMTMYASNVEYMNLDEISYMFALTYVRTHMYFYCRHTHRWRRIRCEGWGGFEAELPSDRQPCGLCVLW